MAEILCSWLISAGPGEEVEPKAPELTAAVTSWAIYGAAFYWSQADYPGSLDEFIQRVTPIILSNLGQPAAINNT